MRGGVSGGCLEEDIRQVGLGVLASGRARVRRYATGEDTETVFGLGLGCDGRVEVLVQPVPPAAALGPWACARQRLDADAAFSISLLVEEAGADGALVVGASGRLAGKLLDAAGDAQAEAAALAALRSERSLRQTLGDHALFTEVLSPPPTLLVCGAGDDARPLVALASGVGFRVVVADHRGAYLTPERLPEARRLLLLRPEQESPDFPAGRIYAVVKTHSLEHDTAWVRRLIGTPLRYVGLLGPRARTRRILDRLGIESDERVFGPVGLDLGADGPEQVAVSVVAELLAVRSGREPRHLRAREVAVHAGS